MSFRSVFVAVVAAFALIVAAFLINRARPRVEIDQPTATRACSTPWCTSTRCRPTRARVWLAQALVGVLGFWFHLRANLIEPGASLWERLVNGAPPMAPLLFPNLVGLAVIGLWALTPHVPEASKGSSWLGTTYSWVHSENEESAEV